MSLIGIKAPGKMLRSISEFISYLWDTIQDQFHGGMKIISSAAGGGTTYIIDQSIMNAKMDSKMKKLLTDLHMISPNSVVLVPTFDSDVFKKQQLISAVGMLNTTTWDIALIKKTNTMNWLDHTPEEIWHAIQEYDQSNGHGFRDNVSTALIDKILYPNMIAGWNQTKADKTSLHIVKALAVGMPNII